MQITPVDFQFLPPLDIPEETRVLCLGENHNDLFHRYFIYKNLSKFYGLGYQVLAVEREERFQDEAMTFLDELESDSDAFSKYSTLLDEGYIATVPWAFSEFKILSHARQLGMAIHFIDAPKSQLEGTHEEKMTQRNIYMADRLNDHTQNSRTVLWGGNLHLYACPKANIGESSIQQQLHQKNIKTHSIALDTLNHMDLLEEVDRKAGSICLDYMINSYEIRQKNSVTVNLGDYTDKAGKEIPDVLMSFNLQTYKWLDRFGVGGSYSWNRKLERNLWDMIAAHENSSSKTKPAHIAPAD